MNEPKVTIEPAEQVGSCNSCQSRPEKVVVVELKTITFRLCFRCARTLVFQLEDAIYPER